MANCSLLPKGFRRQQGKDAGNVNQIIKAVSCSAEVCVAEQTKNCQQQQARAARFPLNNLVLLTGRFRLIKPSWDGQQKRQQAASSSSSKWEM